MHLSTFAAGAAVVLPQLAYAHFVFPHLMLNNVKTNPYEYVREHDYGLQPHNNDWLTSNDFRCNVGSWGHRRDPKTAVVTAGKDVVGFNLHLDFGLYHPGPITIYLSKAPGDVRDYDGSGEWFKVYQQGTLMPWNGTDQGWATWQKKQFTFRLPSEIPAGEYLMRIENMSVHPPYRQKEWYVQCAHLKIQSNYNGRAPGPTCKIPNGCVKASDPAVQLDSWAKPPPTFAPMPGPQQWPN